SAGFAISYAVVRLLLVVEYIRAGRYVPEARPLTGRYSKGFAVAAVIWLISAFVPIPFRFALWGAALLVDFGTPILSPELHAQLAPHPLHLPERFGLFTLIVLGEAVAGSVAGFSGHGWSVSSAFTAALGLSASFGLWWLYFDSVTGTEIMAARECGMVGIYQKWLYAHLPLTIGLAGLGVGITQSVLNTPGPLPDAVRWLTEGSAAVCFLTLSALDLTTTASAATLSKGLGAACRAGAGILMLILAASGAPVRAVQLTGILAALCALLVVIDFQATKHAPDGSTGKGHAPVCRVE
ncbi:MAG TPA: low temperature requirement protein A, partial [Armatimonadota bacterium]